MLRNIKDTGYPLRVEIWSLFTVKLWHLAIADFLMVATTAVSLPLHRVFRAAPAGGSLTWAKGGMTIMSIYQILWLALWIAVPFLLDWTWTSQVFFLLHTMVLLMKMHSYAFYNGHLSETEKRLRALDDPSTASRAPAYLYPTPDNPMGTMASPKRAEAKGKGEAEDSAPGDTDEIAQLREDLARELTSPIGTITYPANLTWGNYIDYICCPTLCYEIEYPRNDKIDWQNLFSKIAAIFGCIFLLTVISEEFILPALVDAQQRLDPSLRTADSPLTSLEVLLILAETISWLLFPFMLTFLLVFLVIFEYVLGACAEITRFADRHFYSDWWNSTDWMEFSREWNVPVYSFLRRHVYSASRPHIGKANATVITFLISAVGHEIVMACITKKLRGYGFICQMLQLPIVVLQRTKWVRGRKTFNNVCFWCSMILGLSLVSDVACTSNCLMATTHSSVYWLIVSFLCRSALSTSWYEAKIIENKKNKPRRLRIRQQVGAVFPACGHVVRSCAPILATGVGRAALPRFLLLCWPPWPTYPKKCRTRRNGPQTGYLVRLRRRLCWVRLTWLHRSTCEAMGR